MKKLFSLSMILFLTIPLSATTMLLKTPDHLDNSISQIITDTTSDQTEPTVSLEIPTESPAAAYTLATIFNFLATLLHNTHNEGTVTVSLSSLLENIFTLIAQTSGKKGQELETFMLDIKKNCNNSLMRAIDELSIALDFDEYKHHAKDSDKDAKTQAALYNVATIVTGVANIVQNPHDKINVGQSVGSILSGIINIALLSSHHHRQNILQSLTVSLA